MSGGPFGVGQGGLDRSGRDRPRGSEARYSLPEYIWKPIVINDPMNTSKLWTVRNGTWTFGGDGAVLSASTEAWISYEGDDQLGGVGVGVAPFDHLALCLEVEMAYVTGSGGTDDMGFVMHGQTGVITNGTIRAFMRRDGTLGLDLFGSGGATSIASADSIGTIPVEEWHTFRVVSTNMGECCSFYWDDRFQGSARVNSAVNAFNRFGCWANPGAKSRFRNFSAWGLRVPQSPSHLTSQRA